MWKITEEVKQKEERLLLFVRQGREKLKGQKQNLKHSFEACRQGRRERLQRFTRRGLLHGFSTEHLCALEWEKTRHWIETMYDKIRRRYEYAALRCKCQEKKKAKRTQKVSKYWPVNSWKLDCPRIEGCDEIVPATPVAALSRHPDPSAERGGPGNLATASTEKIPALQAEIVSEEKKKKNSQAGDPRSPDGNRQGTDPSAFEGAKDFRRKQPEDPRTFFGKRPQGGKVANSRKEEGSIWH